MASIKKLLGGVVGKLLFRELEVRSVLDVSSHFRRIHLGSEGLCGATFHPGDKVQVMLDAGPRTYTPFAFDRSDGSMSFFAFVHSETPGATWAKHVVPGDRVRVFGPRSSLPLEGGTGPSVLFGDETSFAIARALAELRGPGRRPALVFEVDSLSESRSALDHLGLSSDGLVERKHDGSHLLEVGARVRAALAKTRDAELVLTGKAESIQSVRSALRARPQPHRGQKVKAYWAPGKRGLD